jgi:hypothetical protein
LLLNDGGASLRWLLTSLGDDGARLQLGGTHKVGIAASCRVTGWVIS